MAAPNHELDEPSDDAWCWSHAAYKPCRACRNERAEDLMDAQRDEMAEPMS